MIGLEKRNTAQQIQLKENMDIADRRERNN